MAALPLWRFSGDTFVPGRPVLILTFDDLSSYLPGYTRARLLLTDSHADRSPWPMAAPAISPAAPLPVTGAYLRPCSVAC